MIDLKIIEDVINYLNTHVFDHRKVLELVEDERIVKDGVYKSINGRLEDYIKEYHYMIAIRSDKFYQNPFAVMQSIQLIKPSLGEIKDKKATCRKDFIKIILEAGIFHCYQTKPTA